MRYAAKIDANQPAIVKALRKAGVMVQSLAGVGRGVPDLLCGIAGRLVLLEVKEPSQAASAKKLKPLQVVWHQEWAAYPVYVVETIEEALLALSIVHVQNNR